MIEITKDDFNAYLKVRDSGITNMFDIGTVEALTGMNKKQILYIMENFTAINNEFNGNEDE